MRLDSLSRPLYAPIMLDVALVLIVTIEEPNERPRLDALMQALTAVPVDLAQDPGPARPLDARLPNPDPGSVERCRVPILASLPSKPPGTYG